MTVFMRFPEGKPKAVTFSYDDGVEQDRRLVAILDSLGLKGTFNINSGLYAPESTDYEPGHYHRDLSRKDAVSLFAGSGHEVAVHSLTHPFLETLSDSRALYEILEDRENLEKEYHVTVRGMAYPWGTYNDRTVEMAKNAGIVYARTTISTGDFRIPTDWLRLQATCHHNDPRLMDLAKQFAEDSPLKNPYNRNSWLFYVWGHSYEFDTLDNWSRIEEFCNFIAKREDIWYATNIEIYTYIEAFQRLIFSVDGSMVSNPSAMDVYFEFYDQMVRVPAGEAVLVDAAVKEI